MAHWCGRSVFIRHRTQAEIEAARTVDTKELRHKERDEDRVRRPEWLIVVAVCPHMGCLPSLGGEFGGYAVAVALMLVPCWCCVGAVLVLITMICESCDA